MHVGNKKNIVIPCKDPMQGLCDTALTAEGEYSINFIEQGKKFCLSLHYNRSNSYVFVNATKISIQSKIF